MYQAISEENNQSVTYLEVEGRHHGPDEAPKNWKRTAIVWWFTFVVTVVFYSFCIFQTFSPITFRMSEGDYIRGNRHLTEEPSCTVQKAGTEIAVGGIAGVVLVTGAVILIGLTPAGPVAGGLFASNMGAGLAAGSLMSAMQSAVMTGSIYSMGLAIGATAGASTAAATCAQR